MAYTRRTRHATNSGYFGTLTLGTRCHTHYLQDHVVLVRIGRTGQVWSVTAQAGAIRFAFDSGVGTAEVQVSGGADFLQLSPASAPARGLTSWLADAIRDAIIDGRLRVGAHLPATRVLADELGVSRGVIVE